MKSIFKTKLFRDCLVRPREILHQNVSPEKAGLQMNVNRFVTLPKEAGQPIVWNASLGLYCVLVEFITIVEICKQDKSTSFEGVSDRFCQFMDIDLSPYPDFNAACEAQKKPKWDYSGNSDKIWKLREAHDVAFGDESRFKTTSVRSFVLQAVFNVAVAMQFAYHWKTIEWESFADNLDILFIPNEVVDDVLRGQQ